MHLSRKCVFAAFAGVLLTATAVSAQSNALDQPLTQTPTFSITSTLVYLDVSVLDKKGRPVVSGLTRKDFRITEDRRPQRIFSFEAPQLHVEEPGAANPAGKAPVTILVLDLLDSSFANFAYIRYETRRFLMRQPALLTSPMELMVVGNDSLSMLQGYTRDRDDLVHALDRLPAALPYKEMNASFFWERFAQSVDALQQIALQNKGVPGHKIVIWMGRGGPGLFVQNLLLSAKERAMLLAYAHHTTNLLVNSRMSLFVVYPGLSARSSTFSYNAAEAGMDFGDMDPFAGDISFGTFVNTTGGELYYNRNDLARLMSNAEHIGSEYYTLTYQPDDAIRNGRFRRIRVMVDNPNYHVVTKTGYYAASGSTPVSQRQRNVENLTQAAMATVPFTALHVRLKSMVQHPDTRTVDVTVQVQNQHLDWSPGLDGKQQTTILLAAFCTDRYGRVVASHGLRYGFTTPMTDPSAHSGVELTMKVNVHFPRHAARIRVAVEGASGGRIGALDVTRKNVEAAPVAPTPAEELDVRPATAQAAPAR